MEEELEAPPEPVGAGAQVAVGAGTPLPADAGPEQQEERSHVVSNMSALGRIGMKLAGRRVALAADVAPTSHGNGSWVKNLTDVADPGMDPIDFEELDYIAAGRPFS